MLKMDGVGCVSKPKAMSHSLTSSDLFSLSAIRRQTRHRPYVTITYPLLTILLNVAVGHLMLCLSVPDLCELAE